MVENLGWTSILLVSVFVHAQKALNIIQEEHEEEQGKILLNRNHGQNY